MHRLRHRAGFARRFALAAAGALAACLLLAGHAQEASSDAREARTLFNLAKFVTWPASKFASASTPIKVGFFGSGGVRDLFEEANRGTRAGSRELATGSVYSDLQLRDCHILFVNPPAGQNLPDLLAAARRRHVLTVGHSNSFVAQGGMVNFLPTASGVRLQINEKAIRRAGLRLNPGLLALAQIVDDSGAPVARRATR